MQYERNPFYHTLCNVNGVEVKVTDALEFYDFHILCFVMIDNDMQKPERYIANMTGGLFDNEWYYYLAKISDDRYNDIINAKIDYHDAFAKSEYGVKLLTMDSPCGNGQISKDCIDIDLEELPCQGFFYEVDVE